MSPSLYEFVSLDLPALLTGTLVVLVCGLLGNFLLLRRMSLMGDAISHSVLPGLVAGFLIAGTRATLPMFLGAAAAGLVTVGLVDILRRFAKLESGAAMGVAFSILFALGIVLIEQAAASGVDLDPDCVLNGQLEGLTWFPPRDFSLWTPGTLIGERGLPRELWTVSGIAALAAAFVTLFFKELRLTAFDPGLAHAVGVNPRVFNAAFMILVAGAVVASFEAVGSILVIAMLVCPPAIARLLTDRLSRQIWVSVAAALVIGVSGYASAVYGPSLIGLTRGAASAGGVSLTLSVSGMMTVAGGAVLGATMLLAPRYGLLARRVAQRRLAMDIAREDLLASLFRCEEGVVSRALRPTPRAIAIAAARGEVRAGTNGPELTDTGRAAARELVRRHRLWEQFLVDKLAFRADHVHPVAERLEHLDDPEIAARLRSEGPKPQDPHGRPIP